MIIIAGTLRVDPINRDSYLQTVAAATAQARETPGRLDFAQSPDSLEPDRIRATALAQAGAALAQDRQ